MFDIEQEVPTKICLSSIYKKVPDNEIPNDTFMLGRMLELQYHLLEYVFKYLDAKDLHTASLVSPVWDKAAKWELQKRISTNASWISCSCSRFTLCNIETSSNFKYTNPAICIIAFAPRKIEEVCFHVSETLKITFTEYLEKEVVPNNINYCTILCTHLSPSNIKIKNADLLYQAIGLPFIRNIRTTIFNCGSKKKDLLTNFIKDNEQVKCLLLFTQKYRVNVVEHFLRALLKGQNPKNVAVGGGLIKDFSQNNSQRSACVEDLFCIAFLEEEGVEADFNAYSVVIFDQKNEKVNADHFEAEILKLKETSILRKNGVIFRFCCFAKKRSHRSKETVIIEKHFSNYPLLGMEVDGEVGWNSVHVHEEEESNNTTEASSSKSKKSKADVPQSLHGWSTVVVLITWGKKL